MRKITKVLILILMVLGISSCSLFGGGDPYSDTQEITELKEKGQYIDITYAEMLEKCSNNETFVVYVKSLYCSQCYYYLDEIAKVLKEDPSRNIYCVTFEYLEPEELEALKVLVYKVLGEDYSKRIAVEMLSSFGWHKFAPHVMGLDEFGLSAPFKDVVNKFNFTSDELVRRVKEIV